MTEQHPKETVSLDDVRVQAEHWAGVLGGNLLAFLRRSLSA